LDSTKLFQWGIDSEGRLKYLDPGLSYFGEWNEVKRVYIIRNKKTTYWVVV
jgi:hypothetical protein